MKPFFFYPDHEVLMPDSPRSSGFGRMESSASNAVVPVPEKGPRRGRIAMYQGGEGVCASEVKSIVETALDALMVKKKFVCF
jgi:hypothetical protein